MKIMKNNNNVPGHIAEQGTGITFVSSRGNMEARNRQASFPSFWILLSDKKKYGRRISLLPLHNQNEKDLCKPNDSAPQKM